MEREFRYLIFKVKDIHQYLTDEEKNLLSKLSLKIAHGRFEDDRRQLEAIVVEKDWPEYEPTWLAIENRVSA